MKPLISIITVCFNAADTITQTISSVLAQDYPHIEYIIIDGASSDDTLKRIAPFSGKITRVISEPDKGIFDAMNKGLALATGEIIGFLNADDHYSQNDIISTVIKAFAQPFIEACYGDLVYFSKQSQKIVRYWQPGSFKVGAFTKGWNPPHPTFFVKKSVYERCGGFDTCYGSANDIALMMRFLEKYRIHSVYVPRVLVNMQTGGVSNNSVKNIIRQNIMIVKAAKNLNIPFSLGAFIFGKLCNRLWQFAKRSRTALIAQPQ